MAEALWLSGVLLVLISVAVYFLDSYLRLLCGVSSPQPGQGLLCSLSKMAVIAIAKITDKAPLNSLVNVLSAKAENMIFIAWVSNLVIIASALSL